MRLTRGTLRLIGVTLMTAFFVSLFVAIKPIVAMRAFVWRNWIFRTWALTAIALLNIKLDTNNHAPQAPFLLVANHLSYIDIVILASQLDCAFVAKSEVGGWPFVGALCRCMNTVFIKRNNKRDIVRAMSETHELIGSGVGVVLFAEGTSTAGQSVAPFKSSLLELAANQNIPVHYASITYATAAEEISADQSVCWWGDMTFPDHFFRLLQLPGFSARLTFGPEPIAHNDRRMLAARLWRAVSAQFTPVAIL